MHNKNIFRHVTQIHKNIITLKLVDYNGFLYKINSFLDRYFILIGVIISSYATSKLMISKSQMMSLYPLGSISPLAAFWTRLEKLS